MKKFPTHIADYLKGRGFRVLKKKADKELGDRHWIVVQLRRGVPYGRWTLYIMRMTASQKYSVETVDFHIEGRQPGGDLSLLGKAINKIKRSDATLGSLLTNALS